MCWLILLVCNCLILCETVAEGNSKLLLVQALFRHGDRAPVFVYPTDPNKAYNWPEGVGKLTLTGKKQQYAMGKFLRSRYQDFITSNPNEVLVTSSASARCLTSAAALLASFFAPEGRWTIEEDLRWQPIPIYHMPAYQDKMLSFRGRCPRVNAEQTRKVEEIELFQKYQAKFEELSNYTGLNVSGGINGLILYDTMSVEKKNNLTIPEWVGFYWNELEELALETFRAVSSSPLIQRLRVGLLLQDISRNMEKKISGDEPDLRVRLYSTHDVTMASVLMALNFTDMPRPPYCATLLIELHKMADDSMTVRLLYMNSTDPLNDIEQPQVLTLDDCSEFCPLENFNRKLQHLIPENWEEECQMDAADISGNYDKDIFLPV